jgi:serine-type D-Ala-D-Ala carboxypeptidase/endopeptidase (penicillin-binding protein 4)
MPSPCIIRRSRNWLDDEAAPLNLSKLKELAAVDSRPLSEIVKMTLKPSENLYAQLLLLQVGRVAQDHSRALPPGPTGDGGEARRRLRRPYTESAGLAEMEKFLAQIGIPRGQVLLNDGSGLSRSALVTPAASVQLLTYMTHHRAHQAFYDAFPVAGVDGTLHNRFKGTAAADNVHAKTGTLEYVNTISGYVTTKAGEKLVFSVMLNNYEPTTRGPRFEPGPPPDAIINLLADFAGKL